MCHTPIRSRLNVGVIIAIISFVPSCVQGQHEHLNMHLCRAANNLLLT